LLQEYFKWNIECVMGNVLPTILLYINRKNML
jgi:hypothetical protein